MGTSIKDASNKIKQAIGEIRNIIHQSETIEKPTVKLKVEGTMTKQQAEVLKLRCEKKYPFEDIATALNLSQKEVHSEFMAAYNLSRDEHQQQPQSA